MPREFNIMNKSELKNGEMKTVKVDDHEVLVSRIDDSFYALAAHCTHYGATLSDGILDGDRIVCPWHHACFHARTGDLLEPPARDALAAFNVRIEGENVILTLPEEPSETRTPEMVNRNKEGDKRIYVLAGAGAAGNAAAQSLREAGYEGRILLITREKQLPYDRPNLSKDYLQGEADPAWMPLRSEEFYEKHGIELLREKEIERINIPTRTVTFADGETVVYDKLLIAPGGIARNLDVQGSDLKNVFTLRTYNDSDAIIEAAGKGKRAVIIGSSFIGMETAHSLSQRGLKVTVVSRDSVPFQNVLGREIGDLFRKSHEENGVTFKMNTEVEKFEGTGSVDSVVLSNGEKLDVDLVIIGIGVKLPTGFIQGLDFAEDGSIETDKYLKAAENVYAAGDVARFPFWLTGEHVRIEHWRLAEQLGRVAGRNMAGKETAYESVPFFWTNQAGIYFRYVGHAPSWDDIIIHGTVAQKDFLAYFIKNGVVTAVAGSGRDKELTAVHELIRTKKMPSPEKIRDESFDPVEHLKK